jgi:hypothetical protein
LLSSDLGRALQRPGSFGDRGEFLITLKTVEEALAEIQRPRS